MEAFLALVAAHIVILLTERLLRHARVLVVGV
jgi:hypothetical protein